MFSSVIPPQYLQLLGAVFLMLLAINVVVQLVAKMFPQVRWLQIVAHWMQALASSLPKSLLPPAAPTSVGLKDTLSKPKGLVGFLLLPLLTALSLAAILLVGQRAKAQGISFSNPDITFGAVAAVAEVNTKTGAAGVGSGFGLTLELGQFVWEGHTWSAADLSVDVLGGALLPGGAPVGQLQVGGCLGTLNGIVNGCLFSTPYASDGSGWGQGGRPGMVVAGMLNIPALVAVFGGPTGVGASYHLPRGGFGLDR